MLEVAVRDEHAAATCGPRAVGAREERATLVVVPGLDHDEVSAVGGTEDGMRTIAAFLDGLARR